MSVSGLQVVFDCADPRAQARFWAAALGYAPQGRAEPDAAAIVGDGNRLLFLAVPEPKTVKNRVHLDLKVGAEARAAEVERLTRLGATVLYEHDEEERWTTMADPEGNEFCVS